MKFLPLVWRGIWRKPARTLLLLTQIVVAFTLFGVLQGLNTAIEQAMRGTRADHLVVFAASQTVPLPLAMLQQIQKVSGVMTANPRSFVGGTYQRPNQMVGVNATDVLQFLVLEPGVHIPAAQLKALQSTRTGVIAGITSAQRYGWKIGDRISLHSHVLRQDGSPDWTFDIVGIYTQDRHPDAAIGLLGNYSYVNESRLQDRDTVAQYAVLVRNPDEATRVSRQIDSLFVNSPNATITQSESEMLQAQIKQIADVAFLARAVTGSAFIGLLLATSALMMQSNRERFPEYGVLKTVGYSDRRVMALILSESLIICVMGASVGLWLSTIILPRWRFLGGVGPVPGVVLVLGIGFAVVLAVISASIPAWRGLRLEIADAVAGN